MLNDIELQADLNWWKQQKGQTLQGNKNGKKAKMRNF